MHALIVAGPSGAGKSAFLDELRDGGLPAEIRRYLPAGAEHWPSIRCEWQSDWEHLLANPEATRSTIGLSCHYDMTHSWQSFKGDFAADPFWQTMRCCTALTIVVIRPSPRRLREQWMQSHLGTRSPWMVRWRRLLETATAISLAGLSRLRIMPHPRLPGRKHFPRPLRRLKRLQRWLHSRPRLQPTWPISFYRQPRNIERMLACWNETVSELAAAIPTVRIELAPDPATAIGERPVWRMEASARPREGNGAATVRIPDTSGGRTG